jgi:microcompartment protein CcmK/EutM
VGLVTFSACKKSKTDGDGDKLLDANLLKSQKQFSDLLAKRESGNGQTFSIENITRSGSTLNVEIKGGCAKEKFKAVWDGVALLSYPAQVRLVLVNEAGENCNPDQRITVALDLTKIVGADANGYIVYVANGSVKQDTKIDNNGVFNSVSP